MIIAQLWLLKLLISHLLADFILQPKSWIVDRSRKHFASSKLYLHGLVAGVLALLFTGTDFWLGAIVIWVTHTVIDGWKSYRKETIGVFITDQLLHLTIILLCWLYYFVEPQRLFDSFRQVNVNNHFWLMVCSITFLTTPAGILIGQLTKSWREKIMNAESLANAGKWIGIIERLIVFLFVLLGQYAAISLLIAAKGIIRFNEKDRPEVKTEYLVIGTLMSIAISLAVGITVKLLAGGEMFTGQSNL